VLARLLQPAAPTADTPPDAPTRRARIALVDAADTFDAIASDAIRASDRAAGKTAAGLARYLRRFAGHRSDRRCLAGQHAPGGGLTPGA
jgi:hypothetical protein